MAPDRSLISVHFQTGPEDFTTGVPKALFSTRTKLLEIQGTARTYAISSDGLRFLVANATEEATSALIVVDRNWRSAVEK
jgi:hypothetical protein